MTLSAVLARFFSSGVRNRGHQYFWRRAVRISYGSAERVQASVLGGQEYKTLLDYADGKLAVSCECPYFMSGEVCKHLWATVLAAESRSYLSGIRGVPKIRLIEDFDDAYWADDDLPEGTKSARTPKTPAWKTQLSPVLSPSTPRVRTAEWPATRQIVYIVDLQDSSRVEHVVLSLHTRDRKKDGNWSKPAALNQLSRTQLVRMTSEDDREILSALAGASHYYGYGDMLDAVGAIAGKAAIPLPLSLSLVPLVVRTGRCFLRSDSKELTPLTWNNDPPWEFRLQLTRSEQPHGGKAEPGWILGGILCREQETLSVMAPALVTRGHVFASGRVAPLATGAGFTWLRHLRNSGSLEAPASDRDELLSTLLSAPDLPRLDVPEQLSYEEELGSPRPSLRISKGRDVYGTPGLNADLWFDYDGRSVRLDDATRGFYDSDARKFRRRNPDVEQAAAARLRELGVKYREPNYYQPQEGWELPATKLPAVALALVQAGWRIEAEGKVFQRPSAFRLEVSSGIDWFELHGDVTYGTATAKLPALLEALRRGEKMVRLDDGTYGMLPDEWLKKIGMFAGMGTPENGHVRFRKSQVGLLDALLAAQPEAKSDATFEQFREELRKFTGIEPAVQPKGFQGALRDYQREGVGWMEFLRRFGFGGCLADDMGVGKTAQVLALLEKRREARVKLPSLVVVPRSLIFNWKDEAARFTPRLRVLDYSGQDRAGADFDGHHLVLTTYGTLRRDAAFLKDVDFDYVILDEAQAVKNAGSESAKAARLLRAGHRLALSGTPVENHLGELWSLFEFLNPGMLGSASVFKFANGAPRNIDEDTRKLLGHALRPFILRRTKQQVAKELPEKTEQTLYCELKPDQRKLYDELRDHYRGQLLHRIETQGLAKSKIVVLEALLRLRQAACHPGLIDQKRSGHASAKLETLLEQLSEVLEEGHKVLVFSQFTSLLSIVRARLDSGNVTYEYLDGKTRDRQARVDRFQNDPDCKLFLISLKAGGLGLNLTAAEYVFLLDPWWNPAVEAQAVDRAHRIGQTRRVFAYRLIARDTVEERVLELQKTKRQLADAILGEDNALIRNLRREDLELLLS